ncbi:MAG TPA: tetratricopeptide repeat protein, partial [Chitinophagaceae bacterium]|nr:tetratricopeptide repeat protein [Chitinophagaceae bacterium]
QVPAPIAPNDTDENYWINKGLQHNAAGRYADSIECQNKALKINPKSVIALNNKGNSLSSLGRFNEAIECFDKALAFDSKLADTWYARGNAHFSLGNYQEAERSYEKALSADPNHAPTITKLLEVGGSVGFLDENAFNENAINRQQPPSAKARGSKKSKKTRATVDFQPHGLWYITFKDKQGTTENLTIEFSSSGFAGQGTVAYGGSLVAAQVAGSWFFAPATQSLQMQGMLTIMAIGNIPFGLVITIEEKKSGGEYKGTTSGDHDCYLRRQLVDNPFD